jgi:magnesium-transporting ATPase (P-type)
LKDEFKNKKNEKKIKFREKVTGTRGENARWFIIITVASFFLSSLLSYLSSGINDLSTLMALLTVFLIIFIGIIFDIIGIAVTAADETPFHAMASRKLYGAKQAIKLIRNANKVSSVCNDVVGDIAGVLSGTVSAFIIVRISGNSSVSETTLTGIAITGMVASITVGGKAIGKTIAIHNSNYIVYKIAVIIKFITGGGRKKRKK